jgi:GTPase SAR1 family protein
MSAANEESQSSNDALPFRQGALSAEAIRRECPQFRILIIGKANAGKTTILRKVCNAKPDAKPVIYDAEGNEIDKQGVKSRFSLYKAVQRMKGRSTDVPNPAIGTLNSSTDVLNPSTQRGEHNIEYQLTYPSSNFIFHDSRGIEAGSEDELDVVNSDCHG